MHTHTHTHTHTCTHTHMHTYTYTHTDMHLYALLKHVSPLTSHAPTSLPLPQESDTGSALVNLHVRLLQSMESKLIDFQRHLRREFLWKKLLYGPTPGRTEAEVSMVAHCDGLLVVETQH